MRRHALAILAALIAALLAADMYGLLSLRDALGKPAAETREPARTMGKS